MKTDRLTDELQSRSYVTAIISQGPYQDDMTIVWHGHRLIPCLWTTRYLIEDSREAYSKRGTNVASASLSSIDRRRMVRGNEGEDVCSFHTFTIVSLIATMVVVHGQEVA